MIAIKNLCKEYGNKLMLKNINIELEEGKVYGIVGANGSGKTTLFKCISNIEPYDGQIDSAFEILKNHVGFLQTNPVFMSRITGWEYLKLLCIARDIKQDDFEQQNIFDLPLSQYAETYSTGMKKKLAFMGILLQNNDVFILDEPFNGVDIHSNIIIVEIIKKLKAHNKTILVSSHIFSTLSEICDTIHLLKGGEVIKRVEKGAFDALEKEMKSYVIGDKIEKLKIL